MKSFTFCLLVCLSLCFIRCGDKEDFLPEINVSSPSENVIFKVDSSYRDAGWYFQNALIECNFYSAEGLKQVSVQIWDTNKEYFNKVYHLTGESTFAVTEYWEYERTTGNFEARFRAEDVNGEEVLEIRRFSIIP